MPRPSAPLIAALALTLGLSAPAAAAAPKEPARVRFRSTDDARTRLDGYVFRPRGRGPFPAVIALHGCAGLLSTRDPSRLSARHADWARRLVDRGYVVFFPDSFTRRGIKDLCRRGGKRPITPSHRARDVRGAARWLSGRKYVDSGRIALLGWSHGGTTLLWAAREGAAPERGEFKAAFAFYPACRIFAESERWRPRIDVTILIGEADD
jgi:dienelactone hydrolase